MHACVCVCASFCPFLVSSLSLCLCVYLFLSLSLRPVCVYVSASLSASEDFLSPSTFPPHCFERPVITGTQVSSLVPIALFWLLYLLEHYFDPFLTSRNYILSGPHAPHQMACSSPSGRFSGMLRSASVSWLSAVSSSPLLVWCFQPT